MTKTKTHDIPGIRASIIRLIGERKGNNHVRIIRKDGSSYSALVNVTDDKKMTFVAKPKSVDMYTAVYNVHPDSLSMKNVLVWAHNDVKFMALFEPHPIGAIQL